MKIFKFKDQELVLKEADRLSSIFDQLHDGAPSVSIKATERIGGIKEKSDKDLVKAALNKVGGNNSASASIRFTFKFAEEHEDELTAIVGSIHKYNDMMLSNIINQVPTLREQGRQIAIQNYARGLLRRWAERSASYTDDQIDVAMEASGVLVIPEGGFLEASLTMGTLVHELPNYRGAEKHYKAKTVTLSDGRGVDAFVKTSESYGRKKVPFNVAYVDEFAKWIVKFGELFESSMKNSDGSDESNLKGMLLFASELDKISGSHHVEDTGLSKEDTDAAKKMRDDVIKYLEV